MAFTAVNKDMLKLLEAQQKQMEALQAKLDAGNKKQPLQRNENKPRRENGRSPVPEWVKDKPIDLSEVKSFNKRDWYWCDTCEWTTHKVHNANFKEERANKRSKKERNGGPSKKARTGATTESTKVLLARLKKATEGK